MKEPEKKKKSPEDQTPFQKFEQLAKKVISASKEQTEKTKSKGPKP
jgi:hypothetical protein